MSRLHLAVHLQGRGDQILIACEHDTGPRRDVVFISFARLSLPKWNLLLLNRCIPLSFIAT